MSDRLTKMNIAEARKIVDRRPWWYHKFEIFPGLVTPGVYEPSGTLEQLNLPQDMSGMRVLEIGPADGFFTKALTARGADVTAVDYAARDHYGFADMEECAQKKFKFFNVNIYDLAELKLKPFDVVLCLGVLYHLPDPCRALWTIRSLVEGQLILETYVSRKFEDQPIAEYLPHSSTNGDYTNFWAPNPRCCASMLSDFGYVVDKTWINESRAMFHCKLDKNPQSRVKMDTAYNFLGR